MTSRIILTVTRVLFPFILLFGIYIIIFGHLSPGGGFQGGVILATAIMLVIVVYGHRRFQRFVPYLLFIEIIGVILFILIGVSGIASGKQFLVNLGTIPLLNIIIGVKVFSGLVLMYLFLSKWEIKND